MSNRNPRERFDYKSWFERNVAKRTVAALEARDAEFAEKHADTPLAHLAQYVGNRAELLRHTPSPCEIDGGTFIEKRFGGWAAVLEMARLRPPAKEPKLKDTVRYKREKAVQEPLFYEESERKKKAKRAKAAASHAAQQSRLKEKKRLEQVLRHELTPLQRETVIAYYVLQKNIPTIARERGVNKSTVCRTLQRGEARLRRCLRY